MSTEQQAVGQAEMELRQQGSRRVAGSTQSFLKLHAPFDKMAGEALQLFAEKAQLTFYAAGSEIVGPAMNTKSSLRWVDVSEVEEIKVV